MRRIPWGEDLPLCDFCQRYHSEAKPAPYDGPTLFGPFANMCHHHLEYFGFPESLNTVLREKETK